eukprot:15261121-Alexandrium_andersonii.AAC.1
MVCVLPPCGCPWWPRRLAPRVGGCKGAAAPPRTPPLTADVGRPVGVAVPCPVGALWRVRPVGSCGFAGFEGPRA